MSFTTPTYLAAKIASSRSLDHSKKRVISLYRQWQRAVNFHQLNSLILIKAPEIVETYALVIPVSAVRSRIRQEFERHRYVQELPVIDVLLFKGLAEYQVYPPKL
jgi:NADH dehydrogenase (ubiquinone) 1 alpha subcomplex subunit 6